MLTYLFETVADPFVPPNWGVFMVGVPDEIEWSWRSSAVPAGVLLGEQLGWHPGQGQVWVMDLRTREGAMFTMGGDARADLEACKIRVTPQFEAFLEWLYLQDPAQLSRLPRVVKVADAVGSIRGHRHLGPYPVSFTLHKGDTIDITWAGEARMVTCDGIIEDGAIIRDLTAAERLELLGPEDPGPAEDEPGELDYEEMREGLPPPGQDPEIAPAEDKTAEVPPPPAEDKTAEVPPDGDDTVVIPADEVPTQVLPSVAVSKRRR
jgi:hypothetical protein